MKKLISLFGLLLAFHFSFSQKITDFEGEMKWGESIWFSSVDRANSIIGQDGEFVYLKRYLKRNHVVEKYDIQSLTLQKSTILDIKDIKNSYIIDCFMLGETPIFWTAFHNVGTEYLYFFLHKLDPNTLKISSTTLITKVKVPQKKMTKIIFRKISNSVFPEGFLISKSRDFVYFEEHIIIEKTGSKKTIGRLYGEDINLLAENEITFPFENFYLDDKILGDDGLIYITGIGLFEDETIEDETIIEALRKIEVQLLNPEIYIIDIEDGSSDTIFLSVPDRVIKKSAFNVNEDGEILIYGLTEKLKTGQLGSFYIKYDANFKKKETKFIDFEEGFVDEYWFCRGCSEKNKQDDLSEEIPYRYKVRDLIVRPDGSTIFFAEQYYTKYVVSNSSSYSQGRYVYYFEDIIVVNYDANGELIWKTVINKYLYLPYPENSFSSFFTILDGNNINLIYNDRKSNVVDTTGMTKPEKVGLGLIDVAAFAQINEDGEVTKGYFSEFEFGNFHIETGKCAKANNGFNLLYMHNNLKGKIGSIKF